ncbi:MAG: LuxR C-terminal-related transcriptional regulator [Planctomycetota bacterium]
MSVDAASGVSELRYPIFKLGLISGQRELCNRTLLGKAGRVALHACGADSVSLAVFESLAEPPLLACTASVGLEEGEHSQSAFDRSCAVERIRFDMTEVAMLGRDRLLNRDEAPLDASLVPASFASAGGKQLLGVFEAASGRQLLMVFCGLEDDRSEQLARDVAPAVAECCRNGWKDEPVWMSELRPASRQVLELVLQGFDDEQIADITGLTYHSVRAHLKRLFRAASVRSRLHLMQVCRDAGPAGTLAVAG